MIEAFASAAISLDGRLDDAAPSRLILSSPEDFAEVRRLRATCDAIFVGAETVRRDDPSLVTREQSLIDQRLAQGRPAHPIKATLTRSGELDPRSNFFALGDGGKLVYALAPAADVARRLSSAASVVALETASARAILGDLEARGVRRLMVEGGAQILAMFLEERALDWIRLAVAPIFVGDGPRFLGLERLRRSALEKTETFGDTVAWTYRLERAP